MKIAVIAPPYISVPPPEYGGIEQVVYNIVEGLKGLGQDVIFFAPKKSKTSATLHSYLDAPLYFGLDSPEFEKSFISELSSKYAYARAGYEKADIIHDHTLSTFPSNMPTVHTVHGAAMEGTLKQCAGISKLKNNYLVTASKRQKELYLMLNPELKFESVIPHAVNVKEIEWSDKKEDFFIFVGRASWQKGTDIAIRTAAAAGVNLVMAVKMKEECEKEFFKKEIEPLIAGYPKNLRLELFSEIPRPELLGLIKRARATLFTSHWEEPFGLIMVESMACGTPVVAFRRGAAPEIIVEGKTGLLVNTEEGIIDAIKKVGSLKPQDCRVHAEKHFSREVMAGNYLELYKKVISKK